MIKIGGMWFKPEAILAILPHVTLVGPVWNKCELYFGPGDDDSFVVNEDPVEAAKKVNDYFGLHPSE